VTNRVATERAGYRKRVAASFLQRVGVYFGSIEPPPDPTHDVELADRSRRDNIITSAKYFLVAAPIYTVGWFFIDGVGRARLRFGLSTVVEGVASAGLMSLILFFKTWAARDQARARLAAADELSADAPPRPTHPAG
jgi:hypothetical protein